MCTNILQFQRSPSKITQSSHNFCKHLFIIIKSHAYSDFNMPPTTVDGFKIIWLLTTKGVDYS